MKGFGRRALYEVIAMLAFHGLKIRREPGW